VLQIQRQDAAYEIGEFLKVVAHIGIKNVYGLEKPA
jgi:hypothetical protein